MSHDDTRVVTCPQCGTKFGTKATGSGPYRCPACSASFGESGATNALTYKAVLALLSGPNFHPYDSTDIAAHSESEAKAKAFEWARNPKREVLAGTRLVVTIDGKSVLNEPLDWTNAQRP
jgi:hypothetical protein